MENHFFNVIDQVLKILATNEKLAVKNNKVVTFSDNAILTPVGDIRSLLFQHKSRLKDQFIPMKLFQKLIHDLTKNNALVRLNHVGFCYKVQSQKVEQERLLQLIKKTKMHVYLEPSNDEGMWFFIGNADTWEDAMLELIPIEKTKDTWVDYWLPHVQIDIDTELTEEEIKTYVKSACGESVKPFSIAIDDVVYIVRNRLGTINGVNITLDLATNARDVPFHRQKLLKQIDRE